MAGSTKIVQHLSAKAHLQTLISDGEWHGRNDLVSEIGCKGPHVLQMYMTALRKKLPENELIICELVGRTIGYRWVVHKA